MDFYFLTKISFLKISLICCSFTVIQGQIPLKFFVEGDKVIKTGIRHYTAWDGAKGSLNCSIDSSKLSVSHEISLMENSRQPKEEFLKSDRAGFTFQNSDEIEDVGESGYAGEDVTINCDGTGRNRWALARDKSLKQTTQKISLTREMAQAYVCQTKPEKQWQDVCNVPHLTILPFLQVEIIPSSFTTDSHSLEFTCTSSPPRLVYWRLFGSSGDILDFDNYGSYLKTDTNITITQRTGKSILHLSEASPGANGIYAVICFTYGTKSKAASAYLVRSNGNVGLAVTTIVLVVVIAAMVVCCVFMYVKKLLPNSRDAKLSVSTPATDLHINDLYQTCGEQNPKSQDDKDQEYAYVTHHNN